jgi:mono/diheme cytochrome c family protein
MRFFILGIIVTIVVAFVAAIAIAQFGLLPTSADATPPAFETRIAGNALDASMDRHAPRVNNPLPASDQNLIDGMQVYDMNCAVCHGSLDYKPSLLEHSMYPPPPQIIMEPLDDPEWHLYYAIRTGVRYTGMPAWSKALSEQDMWKVTAFLSRLEKLTPAVQEHWKKVYGTSPEEHHGDAHEQHGAHEHHD